MPHEELVSNLASVSSRLSGAVERIPEEALRRPVAGGWSPCQILGHLKDSIALFEVRMEKIVSQERPYIQNWDQDEAALRYDYDSGTPQGFIGEIEKTRDRTIDILNSLDDQHWLREATHEDPEWGTFNLLWLAEHIREHETEHLAELEKATKEESI